MKSDLSDNELKIIGHALGLNTAATVFRNRYLVSPDTVQLRLLQGLEERGHVRFVKAVEESDLLLYKVTQSTIELIEELHG